MYVRMYACMLCYVMLCYVMLCYVMYVCMYVCMCVCCSYMLPYYTILHCVRVWYPDLPIPLKIGICYLKSCEESCDVFREVLEGVG